MKSILTILIFLSLVVSGVAQTRNVVAGTNGAVVSPTNFWSADVTNAFSGLGLGTAATNAASAFQPSSLVLSNLSSSNGGGLTNLTASNITGIVSISNGGSSATTTGGARTNFGLGATWLTNTVASNFLAAIGAQSTNGNGFGLTNLNASNITGQIPASNISTVNFSNFSGTLAVASGGTGATNSSMARTNLGLTFSALTNSDSNSFRSAIGLGISNSVLFQGVASSNGAMRVLEGTNEIVILSVDEESYFAYGINFLNTNALNETRDHLGLKRIVTTDQGVSGWITEIYDDTNATNPIIEVGGQAGVSLYGPIIFGGANASTNRVMSRNNLGLGWSALTNTNASGFNASAYGSGTNPVLYSTNGEVVSPTNFWQVAPIVTRFVEFDPSTNATTNIVASRNLHIHNLAISRTGVTSTIALPITNSFNGDIALVVHKGPTSSVTQVGTQGSTNNLVTMNRTEEAVEFVYYNNVWQFNHNPSFTEPIYFSGTNGVGHAAESRTNLGLPLAALTNTNNANFQAAVFATNTTPTNAGNFNTHAAWMEVTVQTNGSNVSFRIPLYK